MGMDIFNAGVSFAKKIMEGQDNKEYSSKNSDFICERIGEDSFAISTDGITVNEVLTINGTADLSDIIRFNDGGYVKRVRLINNPSSFSLGGYKYEIEVIGSGPRGFSSGSGYLRFTDKSGDTYRLALHKSEERKHVVDYSSDKPDIVKVEWSNVSFDKVDKLERFEQEKKKRTEERQRLKKSGRQYLSFFIDKYLYNTTSFRKDDSIIAFSVQHKSDKTTFLLYKINGDNVSFSLSEKVFTSFFALATFVPYIGREQLNYQIPDTLYNKYINDEDYLVVQHALYKTDIEYKGPIPNIDDFVGIDELNDLPQKAKRILYNLSELWQDGSAVHALPINESEYVAWKERLEIIKPQLSRVLNSCSSNEENECFDYSETEDEDTNEESSYSPSKEYTGEFPKIKPESYARLAEIAMEENWFYGDKPVDRNRYPILKSYIYNTYLKLKNENKVMVYEDAKSNKSYSAFNTGLVDKKYDNIYALSHSYINDGEPSERWHLDGFFVAGEDWGGKLLTECFNPLPKKADYFGKNIYNLIFDSSKEIRYDVPHILCERIERYPLEFIEDNIMGIDTYIGGMTLREAYSCDDLDVKEQYFEELGKRIYKDERVLKVMTNKMKNAISLAIKRTEWNYKTAIPMYYPRKNKVSLLLPISLMDELKADLALVVEYTDSGAYQAQTVLTLEMAYVDSRLIARPDSDWLRTNIISESEVE